MKMKQPTAKEISRWVDIAILECFPNRLIATIKDISEKLPAKDKIGYRIQFQKTSASVFLKIIFTIDSNSKLRRKKFAKDFAITEIIRKYLPTIPTTKTITYQSHPGFDYYFVAYIENSRPFIDTATRVSKKEAIPLLKSMAKQLSCIHAISLQKQAIKNALRIQFGNKTPAEIWETRKKSLLHTAHKAAKEIGDKQLMARTRETIKRLTRKDTNLSLLHNDYIRNLLTQDAQLKAIIDFEEAIPGNIHLELARAKWWFIELHLPDYFDVFLKAYTRHNEVSEKTLDDYYTVFLLEYFQYAKNTNNKNLLLNTLQKLKKITP